MTRPETETGDPSGASGPLGSSRVWMIELPVERPPLTYNRLMGKHWSVVHREKVALVEAGFYLSRSAHPSSTEHGRFSHEPLPRPFPSVVTIELAYWPGNNTVHDPDNMAPTLKYLIDGMRKAGVLADDRGKYVRTALCTVIELADDPEQRTDARMMLIVRELSVINL
jgi:hypothetical protein